VLALLIDENLNHRILRGLLRSVPHLDYKLAAAEELQGADDPKVLDFAAKQNLVLVTHDLRTVPKFAYQRVKEGLPMPGVIAVPDDVPIGRAIEDLGIVTECASPSEVRSLVIYLPL
jgi:hypothetical protein